MRSAAVLVVAVLASCGRVDFDPLGDGGGAGPGPSDGPRGDGGGGDSGGGGNACSFAGTPSCPITGGSLTNVGTVNASGNTSGDGDGLSGSCGGAGSEEWTATYIVQTTATYQFTTAGSGYDTVLYARDGSCAGAELACNDNASPVVTTSQITLALTAGQQVVVVVDGAHGECGTFHLLAGASP